jgi:hypothetical protein
VCETLLFRYTECVLGADRDGGRQYGRRCESAPGVNRRRHVRVDCDWPVSAVGIELTGTETAFEATVRNISTGGLYLETNVRANLAVDKPLRITLPDPIGVVEAIVAALPRARQGWRRQDQLGCRVHQPHHRATRPHLPRRVHPRRRARNGVRVVRRCRFVRLRRLLGCGFRGGAWRGCWRCG